jgi:hypothetical protein
VEQLRKSVIYLAALSLLTISLAGVAYAHWSKVISVDGLVQSGELEWVLVDMSTTDPPGANDRTIKQGFIPPAYTTRKDVAETIVWFTEHTGYVEIKNAYPCYLTSVNFYPQVQGTIPIYVDKLLIYYWDSGTNEWIYFDTLTHTGKFEFDYDDNGKCDIEFQYGDNFGVQYHPGDDPIEISFSIHICEDAKYLTSYKFKFDLYCINWNEYVSPP